MSYLNKKDMRRSKNIISIFLLCSLILFSSVVFSQTHFNDFPAVSKKLEKIEAQKVAFLTKKLRLTTSEAQQFWPVYNEFEEKRKTLQKEFENNNPERLDFIFLTDQEALQIADNRLNYAQKQLNLQLDFHKKIKAVLPPKKVLMYYEANKEFRRMLLRKLRK